MANSERSRRSNVAFKAASPGIANVTGRAFLAKISGQSDEHIVLGKDGKK
jgi:hypothetical protein